MEFHSNVLGTDLMAKKMSEKRSTVNPRVEAAKILRVHLASIVRCCPGY